VSADYSDPGVAKVRTESDWENKCRDIVEGCGIIGIGDVIFKVRSPIPHIDLNDMLIGVAYSI
jgi:hypothetical protein